MDSSRFKTQFNDWSDIIRKCIATKVNKLQSRITKAISIGKRFLVKRLQYLLQNSFFAKLLAVAKVTTNKGKNTPWIDWITWKHSTDKFNAVYSLHSKWYKAKPLRRVLIPKKNWKKRPLWIPTMYDRALQALHTITLEPISEFTSDKRSFGFRKYRSCHDACQQIFHCLSGEYTANRVLEGDIKGCFDNISHERILNNIPINKKVLLQFLKAGYVFNKQLFPTHAWTPQWGIISPILANMTLDWIENILLNKYRKSKTGCIHKRHNKSKVNFIRYADDFIITANSEDIAMEIKGIISKFLQTRGLSLSEEKTVITHIQNWFDFLGWNIIKPKKKLFITPSKDSFKWIKDKIRTTIKRHRANTSENLIKTLNPIIKGWCNYHNKVVSKKTFQSLDSFIFVSLWNWAKRRHPMKPRHWIKDKYYTQRWDRNWIFSWGDERITLATDTKIRRHRMIKFDMNPFMRQHKQYFAIRMKYYRDRHKPTDWPPSERSV